MLESGDLEMMLPFFNMFSQMLSNNAAQEPAFMVTEDLIRLRQVRSGVAWAISRRIHREVLRFAIMRGFLELSMMMLDYYEFTGDTNFLASTLLPAASAGLDFYDQHFGLDEQRQNGFVSRERSRDLLGYL